jgi:hypothetical protein
MAAKEWPSPLPLLFPIPGEALSLLERLFTPSAQITG